MNDDPSMPAPVLLVHGWNAHARSMRFVAARLRGRGYAAESIMALEFTNTWGSNIDHAAEIAQAVGQLLDRTRAERIDIVAHSMGGLATRWFIARTRPVPPIRRIVFIATPHRGTWMSALAWGRSAPEMRPGSPFLEELARNPLPSAIETFTIRTRLETHVLPFRSARWSGARADHLLSFPPHGFMLRSRVVADRICDCLTAPSMNQLHGSAREPVQP